jgi:SAM-dependent methyltransferase
MADADTCHKLRWASSRKRLVYDQDLQALVRNHPSHRFLENPASQNVYLHSVEFVQAFSEHFFQRPISELAIMDWGCGKGHVSFLLRRRGASVTSCDYHAKEQMDDDSAFGQDTPIIEGAGIPVERLEDPVRLPYFDGVFDVALSFGVLEHVENDLESLKEIRRVLRPGGIFFCFCLPNFLSWTKGMARLLGDTYHDRLYSKRFAEHLVTATGYKLIDIWHRQLFPKNRVHYPMYGLFESLDQSLVRFTPLKYFATFIEFVAVAQ